MVWLGKKQGDTEMTAAQLIVAKIAERTENGLGMEITFEGRGPFRGYAKDAAQHAAWMQKNTAKIGTIDECGHKVISVRAL